MIAFMASKYPRIKCPQCDADFGQECRFLDHLTRLHGVKDTLDLYIELNHRGEHPTCQCSRECDVKLRWSGWKKGFTSQFARGHNAKIDTVFADPVRAKEFALKRVEGYASGRLVVHNKGVLSSAETKAKTSATLLEGYASGRLVDWRAGDPKKAQAASRKTSETKRRRYASGEIEPWNKGQTKHTSPLLAMIAASISATQSALGSNVARRFTPEQLITIVAEYGNGLRLVTDLTTYLNKYQHLEFECPVCLSIQVKSLMMLVATPVCFKCHPKDSKAQIEVFDFVRQYALDALISTKDVIPPQDIDVYVPGKLAVEFNGLYWHSEVRQPDRAFHAKKSSACAQTGVHLLHVWEDEWRDKREIVSSIIVSRLGVCQRRFMARKLTVKKLNVGERRDFFTANHLDGDVDSHVAWGLFDGVELVSAMSLRYPQHRTAYPGMLEVGRFCTKTDTSVAGGLSRLISRAQREGFTRLVTYVDTRFGDGHGYEEVGFKLHHTTGNRYWYTDFKNRFPREEYQARDGFTEDELAEMNGVVKIYGCPNKVFTLVV